jgi:hypothetical protein
MVDESSRVGGAGRRSGELPPCCMFFKGARAGIFEGLFAAEAIDMTELASGFRTLALKLETGVFARLGGGGPRTVPARLGAADRGRVAGFVGIAAFEGVFARGGAAFDEVAYSSSR